VQFARRGSVGAGGSTTIYVMAKILVVDDDPHIREVVSFALGDAGFETVEAEDGARAVDAFARTAPDLVVLDIVMPELDGTEVCRRIRATSAVPILFLSSRDDEVDRILGLEIGGDDYLTKPFSPRELVARVRAVLRRVKPDGAPAARSLRHGRLALDLDRFTVAWEDREAPLTVTELGILRTLLGRPGKVYSRDELMDRAYDDSTIVADRTIDSHVRRVRSKLKALGADPIETVHGAGYRLGPC
jgi:two-component system OmpR family response regulator